MPPSQDWTINENDHEIRSRSRQTRGPLIPLDPLIQLEGRNTIQVDLFVQASQGNTYLHNWVLQPQ